MTGYGKTQIQLAGKSVIIEIKTLNSKQLDLNARIPSFFKEKENEIRLAISKELERGKIDLYITVENMTSNASLCLDEELAMNYYQLFSNLSQKLNNPVESDIFMQVLKMPDVLKSRQETLTEEDWQIFVSALEETCRKVRAFREDEGAVLAVDFKKRINLIDSMIDKITPYEEERIVRQREKFLHTLEEQKIAYDANRLEQEIIFYLEKLDVTEEKVRLRKHCRYFLDTLEEPTSNGKKLGFISQECGREINTLGSKSNHFGMQQIVVCMKDELEKIKEQLANVL